jgi:GNAT superfamily N-acetyltransferase
VIESFEQVPPEFEGQVRALLRSCFDTRPRTPEELAMHRDRFSSAGDAIRHIVALENQIVVGFVRVFLRSITFDSHAIALGGIGDVCTHPDWRGRGIARAALEVAMQTLREAHADVAYLCADLANPSRLRLYGQFGFVPLGRPQTYVGPSGTRYTDDDAMLAPVRSQAVFDRVMSASEPFDIGRGNW